MKRSQQDPGVRYLREVEKKGVEHFLSNGAGLSIRLYGAGGRIIPVVISQGLPGAASILSPTAHYLHYPVHEISRTSRIWGKRALNLVLSPLAVAAKLGRMDNVAYINHWLINGAPRLKLDTAALHKLLDEIRSDYPDHTPVCSGVIPDLMRREAGALVEAGARPVHSREVFLADPAAITAGNHGKKARQNLGADRRLWTSLEPARVQDTERIRAHVDDIRELYSRLYLEKYPRFLNPQYRHSFFTLLLDSGLLHWSVWFREGRPEAFNAQWIEDGVLTWSCCGYDTAAPVSRGLFRVIAADDVETALQHGAVINWGGGNREFKRLRGAQPHFEYDMVFDDHLGKFRRLPWTLIKGIKDRKNRARLEG